MLTESLFIRFLMKVNYLESLVRVEMFLQGVMIEISFVANGTVIRKGAHVGTNMLLISRFRSKTFEKKGRNTMVLVITHSYCNRHRWSMDTY